jgi:hypothetical protein
MRGVENLWLNLIFWPVVFLGMGLYVRKIKHPARGMLPAFLQFAGILVGVSLLFMVVAVMVVTALDLPSVPPAVAGPVFIVVIVPSFYVARKRIASPP